MSRIVRHWRASELATEANPYKKNWISKVLSAGLKPLVLVVQSFDSSEWVEQAEMYWIGYFNDLGCKLTNIIHRANGRQFLRKSDFLKWKDRVREGSKNVGIKLSAARRKYYEENPIEKKKAGDRLRKWNNSPEGRRQRSAVSKKMWADPDTKKTISAAISKAKKGVPQTPEAREANRKASLKRATPIFGQCLSTGELIEFDSKRAACRHVEGQLNDVNKVLRDQHKQCKGWTFAYSLEELQCKN